MLYIADLNRDGLLKVGIASWYRTDIRASELKRRWKAPNLSILSCTVVPYGWGSEGEWERRLIARLKRENGMLQLFAGNEKGKEIVDCTRRQALDGLKAMHRETEIDIAKNADEISLDKVDWRFCNGFLSAKYNQECRQTNDSVSDWRDVTTRQVFINWLRGDELASMPEQLLSPQ